MWSMNNLARVLCNLFPRVQKYSEESVKLLKNEKGGEGTF